MQKLWGVNVDGTYLCAVEVAKHMIERKRNGSMVFIGSMSGSIVNVPQPQVCSFFFFLGSGGFSRARVEIRER